MEEGGGVDGLLSTFVPRLFYVLVSAAVTQHCVAHEVKSLVLNVLGPFRPDEIDSRGL